MNAVVPFLIFFFFFPLLFFLVICIWLVIFSNKNLPVIDKKSEASCLSDLYGFNYKCQWVVDD